MSRTQVAYRARWVLPIASPPLRDGWLKVAAGRIVAIGAGRIPRDVADPVDLGEVALLPGLVNAHTHLELSWLRGRVPRAAAMPDWARALMERRRLARRDDPAAIEEAVGEAAVCGTALIGDVTNSLAAHGALARSELAAIMFLELIKFNAPDGATLVAEARARIQALPRAPLVRATLAAHAPYSVGPDLLAALAAARQAATPFSVHVAESDDEIEFLQTGTGRWRRVLEDLDAWDPAWRPPGCDPVAYLDGFGLVDGRLLAVHAVHCGERDLARLAEAGATVVTCPRSNRWTGAGEPPVACFYASGVRVAVGTDSLASVPDLNVLAELAELRRLAPGVPADRLLASATREGASALGLGGDLGTLEPGKRPALVAISVPAGETDVEEYLVSGIGPDRIRRVEF